MNDYNECKPRVLVVDDDSAVRWMIKKVLQNDFTVLIVNTGSEAIRLMDGPAFLNALVTDFDLKGEDGIDGLDVAQKMRTLHPRAPIILATGTLASEPRIQQVLRLPNTAILEKPFSKFDLVSLIRSLLKI